MKRKKITSSSIPTKKKRGAESANPRNIWFSITVPTNFNETDHCSQICRQALVFLEAKLRYAQGIQKIDLPESAILDLIHRMQRTPRTYVVSEYSQGKKTITVMVVVCSTPEPVTSEIKENFNNLLRCAVRSARYQEISRMSRHSVSCNWITRQTCIALIPHRSPNKLPVEFNTNQKLFITQTLSAIGPSLPNNGFVDDNRFEYVECCMDYSVVPPLRYPVPEEIKDCELHKSCPPDYICEQVVETEKSADITRGMPCVDKVDQIKQHQEINKCSDHMIIA